MNWYLERIRAAGDAPAFLSEDGPFTYAQLSERIDAWNTEFERRGLTAGSVVLLEADFTPDSAALLLALMHHGCVAVPLRPRDHERELKSSIARAQHEFVFSGAANWSYAPLNGDGAHAMYTPLREDGCGGLIIFTSGTTGGPRGALHRVDRFFERFRKQRKGLRTIAFLLLDHIGGLNSLFAVLGSGGCIVSIVDRGADAVGAAVERHRVQLLPTTPTFLRMLLIAEAWHRYDLSSLEIITYGTEPMPEATLRDLQANFPGVQLKQTYGLTELGIMPVRSPEGDSSWFSIGGDGYESRIVDGTLRIRARTSMLGYLNGTAPFDDEGWYDTGDYVEEKNGYIRVLGRNSEIINVGGEKVLPVEVESVILHLPNVQDVVVYGKKSPVTGEIVAARVRLKESEDPGAAERRIREGCARKLAAYKVPALVLLSQEQLHGERYKKLRAV